MDTMVARAAVERPYELAGEEANGSGVCWAAVIGGAVAAAALALILLVLGVGLGLSSISPWSRAATWSAEIGIATVAWLILTQAIASAMGGYLAGRLRGKWASVHDDEVYFRDTAHGFLAWAVAVVLTAAFLTSAASSIVGTGAMVGGSAAAGAVATGAPMLLSSPVATEASAARTANPPGAGETGTAQGRSLYYGDLLLRSDHPAADAGDASRAELGRMLFEATRNGGELSPADRAYAVTVVAAQTGLSPADADKRVSDVLAQAKAAAAQAEATAMQAADAARRAAARTALWLFVALLTGAFAASLAATIGGRQRDRVRAASGARALR